MLKLPRATDDCVALSGRVWNRAAEEIERLANLQVSPPLELNDGPAGRRLAVRIRPDRLYWGVVQCHGPQGTEADFPDNRYWVALGYVSNDQTDAITSVVKVTAYPVGDSRRKVIAATNFFESNDGTHLVRPETIVRVWAEYDRGLPAQLRWTLIVADEGTNKAEPCSAESSGSLSGSDGDGSSSGSSSSGACPPGYSGLLQIGGPITRLGDRIEQTVRTLEFCDGALVSTGDAATISVEVCCPPGESSASASDSSASCCASYIFTFTNCGNTGSFTVTLTGSVSTGFTGSGATLVMDDGGFWRLTSDAGPVFTALPDNGGCPPLDLAAWANVEGCVGATAVLTSITCGDATCSCPSDGPDSITVDAGAEGIIQGIAGIAFPACDGETTTTFTLSKAAVAGSFNPAACYVFGSVGVNWCYPGSKCGNVAQLTVVSIDGVCYYSFGTNKGDCGGTADDSYVANRLVSDGLLGVYTAQGTSLPATITIS